MSVAALLPHLQHIGIVAMVTAAISYPLANLAFWWRLRRRATPESPWPWNWRVIAGANVYARWAERHPWWIGLAEDGES